MQIMTVEKDVKVSTYDRKDVLKYSIDYFSGDELAAEVWINKYALKDSNGNIFEKNPRDMHNRIASEIARIESNYPNPMSHDEIFQLLDGFKYIIPAGSPMSGIGNNLQAISLSNCFVIGLEGNSDSYGAIMHVDQEQVQLMKRRGGVGHTLEAIRPAGSPVKNSALTSTGVVPFMERYSNSTREVAQDGRRGALMLSMSVKHPDSEAFIDAKMSTGKVTGANVSVKITDEFMKSILSDGEFIQQWPIDVKNPKNIKKINSKDLWKKIIYNAWKSAEPGVLFWDKILRESLADCYSDLGYETISTNPCVTGDTLVYTADGRGSISIKQLAEEGKDVQVFTLNDNGKLKIRTMRHPRITGYNKKIYKVTLDDGSIIRTTANHKFRLKSGLYKRVDELEYGDSLDLLIKYQATFEEIFENSNSKSSRYEWIKYGNNKSSKSEHRLIAENKYGEIPKQYVVHHIDHNSLNNSPDNLQMMSKKDHDFFHRDNVIGDNNPMRKAQREWTEIQWKQYCDNMSKSVSGENNGRYKSDISNEEFKEHALILTKQLNIRFSKKDWINYAKKNNLPMTISNFRKDKIFGGILGLAEWAALELGIINKDLIGFDLSVIKSYFSLIKDGYNVSIQEGKLNIHKNCEICGEEFIISDFRKRETSVCHKNECRNERISRNNKKMWKSDASIKIKESKKKFYDKKRENNTNDQIKAYSDLKFKLKRDPLLKEWYEYCKEIEVSNDLRPHSTNIKRGWKELKVLAEDYNHKVVSIEFDGYEDVYNGTVDDFHNFFVGGFESKMESGGRKILYINNLQCGEIPLCPDDSCRLLSVNLYSYVVNPFTKDAYFDFDLFKTHARYALRIMDDIIDLEIEKIDMIIEKIKSDPEDSNIKQIELDLWKRIQKKCKEGRRTGVGITAEGDMLAALGLRYGTKKATDFSVEVHKTYAIEVFRSSNQLAKERGTFKVWDPRREKKNPFMNRIKEEDLELYKELMTTGRRNIACLTIAPTGSVSILTKTTSGIEPAFSVAYKRRRKINPNDKNVRIDFIDDIGDCWEEYNMFHPKFAKWLKVNGYNVDEVKEYKDDQLNSIIEKSPYYKAMANDVNWVEKVRMQGRIQDWVDHSISVTVNLPEEVTEDLVNKVYITAWKEGCKGCTIYREGSRSGVLISKENKKIAFQENSAPKRPKELECVMMIFQNSGVRWIGFIGILDGRPYEVFTGKHENFPVPGYIESGRIIKTKGEDGISNYDFHYVDTRGRDIVIPNLNHAFDEKYHDYAKMISGVLRHGMPVHSVAALLDGLKLDGDFITTWKAGVKRMLKKFIKDGTKEIGQTCDKCGSDSLEYKEGCLVCMGCGASKC